MRVVSGMWYVACLLCALSVFSLWLCISPIVPPLRRKIYNYFLAYLFSLSINGDNSHIYNPLLIPEINRIGHLKYSALYSLYYSIKSLEFNKYYGIGYALDKLNKTTTDSKSHQYGLLYKKSYDVFMDKYRDTGEGA